MATWSQWHNDVMPELPGGPQIDMVNDRIRDTVIDFCRRTRLLQRTSPTFNYTSQGPQPFPTSAISTNERIVALLAVWWLDQPLTPLSAEEAAAMYGAGWQTKDGTPLSYVQDRPDVFWLVPSPTSAVNNALRVRVSYTPNFSATAVDDLVFDHYREIIAFGAKARLMAMPGKPWTNLEMAGFYADAYETRLSAVTIKAMRGPMRRPLQTKPYPF